MSRRKVKPISGGRSINDASLETAADIEEHIAELIEDIERKQSWLDRAREVLASMRGEQPSAASDAETEWNELGRRLRVANPESYRKVLAAAEAFLSIYENPDEGHELFMARLRDISRSGGTVN